MKLNKRNVVAEIKKKISSAAYADVMKFVKNSDETTKIHLWGEHTPKLEDMVALTIYKALYNHGYHKLADLINFGYKITDHSLRHNIQVLRKVLNNYGEKNIVLGDAEDWEKEAGIVERLGDLAHVNLWMDSSDFKKFRKISSSRKGPEWSYKLNGPGRRYMFLQDAKGRFRKVWGGYTPKLYDGDFLAINKQSIETELEGAQICADNHFSVGKRMFNGEHKPKIFTNFAIQKKDTEHGNEPAADKDVTPTINKHQRAFNKIHQKLRARVEMPYGLMKTKFQCLAHPWQEDDEQLDYQVRFAAGLLNFMKN